MYRMIYVYGGPGRRSAAPNRQALHLPYGSVTPSDPASTFAKRAVPPLCVRWWPASVSVHAAPERPLCGQPQPFEPSLA
jgi:hypothetical protein